MEELITLITVTGWMVVGLIALAGFCVYGHYSKMAGKSLQEIDWTEEA